MDEIREEIEKEFVAIDSHKEEVARQSSSFGADSDVGAAAPAAAGETNQAGATTTSPTETPSHDVPRPSRAAEAVDPLTPAEETPRQYDDEGPSILRRLADVNKELWLILSVFGIAVLMNYVLTGHRMVLGLYTLPTLFSAYFFGRRHATLTAFASVFFIGLLTRYNPSWFKATVGTGFLESYWFDFTAWGGILIITAYTMGLLHDRNKERIRELRQTYRGLLLILRQFISKDKYADNHSYRVSLYSTRIASYLGFNPQRMEILRAAALLHDIGKLDINRQLIYKAACLNHEEYEEVKNHIEKGHDIIIPVVGPLGRIIPIILAQHGGAENAAESPRARGDLPLEARIISVADTYDSLTSDQPHRKAMSPIDAKETIVRGAGEDFDPMVVEAFLKAFRKNDLEVPELVLQ
jgi:hypothetical protein